MKFNYFMLLDGQCPTTEPLRSEQFSSFCKRLKVKVIVEMTDNNYSAYLEALQGCVSTGETFEELKNNINEAVAFHLDGLREDGEPIPAPFDSLYELEFKFDIQRLMTP